MGSSFRHVTSETEPTTPGEGLEPPVLVLETSGLPLTEPGKNKKGRQCLVASLRGKRMDETYILPPRHTGGHGLAAAMIWIAVFIKSDYRSPKNEVNEKTF